MNKTYLFFNKLFRLVSEILFSWIKHLSPYATAVLPGFFFGWTIGQFVLQLTGSSTAAVIVGSSAFIVLESAGIWSGHKIAEFLGERDWKIIIPILTFLIYITVGIGTLWLLDGEAINNNVKIIGSAMFILAGVIYILFGLQAYQERMERQEKRDLATEVKAERDKEQEEKLDIENEDKKQRRREKEDEDREHQRKMEVKKINAENKRKLLEIQSETEIQLAGVPAAVPVVQQPVPMIEQVISSSPTKKKPRVNETKMTRLRALLKVQPGLIDNKSKLARNTGVSRPTLNRYLQIIEDENNV